MDPRWRVLAAHGVGGSASSHYQSEAKARGLFAKLIQLRICAWVELQVRSENEWKMVEFSGHRIVR